MKNSTPTSIVETQRYHLTLIAGDFALTLRPPLVIIRFDSPSCQEVLRRLGPPRLFHGMRADHLTIPLEPVKCGPMAGLINIHLTYGAGRDSHHETVARLEPKGIEAAFRPFAQGLCSYFFCAARRVTVEDLQREGYLAVVLSDEAQHWLDERTSAGRWKERVTPRKLATLESHLDLYDAQIIDDLRRSGGSQTAFLMRETDGQALSVGYQPTGFGPDHTPGWYAIPMASGVLATFEELLPTAFGAEFFDTLMVIARELQVGIDLDGVMRARARALTAKRAGPTSVLSADP